MREFLFRDCVCSLCVPRMTLPYLKLSTTLVKHAASNTSMIGEFFKDCVTRLETFFVRLAFVKFLSHKFGLVMR